MSRQWLQRSKLVLAGAALLLALSGALPGGIPSASSADHVPVTWPWFPMSQSSGQQSVDEGGRGRKSSSVLCFESLLRRTGAAR